MELCDLYLKYMNALCEGTLAAPEGIALSGETPEERAMSLQAALKNVSVPDFVRRCADAAGDSLPDGLLDGFHEEDFARALFARMALGGAPQPEEPPAPAGEADEPGPRSRRGQARLRGVLRLPDARRKPHRLPHRRAQGERPRGLLQALAGHDASRPRPR